MRRQAKQYAQIPNRTPTTYEYIPSDLEEQLYDKLFAYCQKEHSIVFPEMNAYDLSLRLLCALEKVFRQLKKVGAAQKALVFMESLATQSYLYPILVERYPTVLYNGNVDYSAIQNFKVDAQILLSTDLGARGFNLEECSFIVQYDLLYNTLKMEQRIDRCHRLGQKNDVVVLSFIDKNNFADVRKLELVNKRMLVADGVLGLSDEVVGGFTDNLDTAFAALAQNLLTSRQVEAAYMQTLLQNEVANKKLVSSAEGMLGTRNTSRHGR